MFSCLIVFFQSILKIDQKKYLLSENKKHCLLQNFNCFVNTYLLKPLFLRTALILFGMESSNVWHYSTGMKNHTSHNAPISIFKFEELLSLSSSFTCYLKFLLDLSPVTQKSMAEILFRLNKLIGNFNETFGSCWMLTVSFQMQVLVHRW